MAKSLFVVFDTQYGDKFEPEVVCSNADQAVEWCLERWNNTLRADDDIPEATDINETPFRIVEVAAYLLNEPAPKMTDSEVIAAFADVLNRFDGTFARGKAIMGEEDMTYIKLSKYARATLTCDDDGKLIDICADE